MPRRAVWCELPSGPAQGVRGIQAFHFIGSQAFHSHGSTHVYGELRYANHILQGDVNGDGKADFEVHVNAASLATGDFVL
jgi:serralysin